MLIYVLSDGAADTRRAVNYAAVAHNFTPILIDIKEPADIAPAFRSLADARADVGIVAAGSVFLIRPRSNRGRRGCG